MASIDQWPFLWWLVANDFAQAWLKQINPQSRFCSKSSTFHCSLCKWILDVIIACSHTICAMHLTYPIIRETHLSGALGSYWSSWEFCFAQEQEMQALRGIELVTFWSQVSCNTTALPQHHYHYCYISRNLMKFLLDALKRLHLFQITLNFHEKNNLP